MGLVELEKAVVNPLTAFDDDPLHQCAPSALPMPMPMSEA
jgi:hypothetical protein